MSQQGGQIAVAKVTAETFTASAASVGVMTLFGITLNNWVMILTCAWFLVLISKWLVVDILPALISGEKWAATKYKNYRRRADDRAKRASDPEDLDVTKLRKQHDNQANQEGV